MKHKKSLRKERKQIYFILNKILLSSCFCIQKKSNQQQVTNHIAYGLTFNLSPLLWLRLQCNDYAANSNLKSLHLNKYPINLANSFVTIT